jgi:hypothetical protein
LESVSKAGDLIKKPPCEVHSNRYEIFEYKLKSQEGSYKGINYFEYPKFLIGITGRFGVSDRQNEGGLHEEKSGFRKALRE